MKKYLVAGLLVWLPVSITIWVLSWALGVLDSVFRTVVGGLGAVLPSSAQQLLTSMKAVPGLGVLLLLTALLLTGVFVANFVGQWWIKQWDTLLSRIPIVKSIYNSVKQVSDTLFSSNGQAFREAVLVEYPRAGSWTIAFVTGRPAGDVGDRLPPDCLSLYVPTTPNPTSGFLLMVPASEVRPLGMSVDEALKYIISMGVVAPVAPAAPATAPAPLMKLMATPRSARN
ncbi:MAG: hypothetical protein RIQ60_1210 [Pseudomonadota bacterium]